jgi:hypothetical protein
MGDADARAEWFASQNEVVDLMFHLSPLERYEFAMLKQYLANLTDFLTGVEGGKRFYAYRWLSTGTSTSKETFQHKMP